MEIAKFRDCKIISTLFTQSILFVELLTLTYFRNNGHNVFAIHKNVEKL